MYKGTSISVALAAVIALVASGLSSSKAAAEQFTYTAKFTDKGELIRPEQPIWREWVYIGTPVTPNSLNDGEAPFPEIHSVYIEPGAFAHYKKTGEFPEGTVIAKELALVGATEAPSGNGFFMGEFQGLEFTIKSKKLYPDEPGNWAYYTFGHKPEPYDKMAKKMPAEACNACHEASAAEDWVFTEYYPVLRAAKPK